MKQFCANDCLISGLSEKKKKSTRWFFYVVRHRASEEVTLPNSDPFIVFNFEEENLRPNCLS